MLTLKYTDFWIPRFVHSAIKIWFSFPSKRFWFLLIPLRKMCSRWQMITLTCFSFEDVCNILHIMYIELYTLVGRKKIKVCSPKRKQVTFRKFWTIGPKYRFREDYTLKWNGQIAIAVPRLDLGTRLQYCLHLGEAEVQVLFKARRPGAAQLE